MKNAKISQADVCRELDECIATACFLAESVPLILEQYAGFTEKCPVPHGASICLDSLSDKLRELRAKI